MGKREVQSGGWGGGWLVVAGVELNSKIIGVIGTEDENNTYCVMVR